MVSKLPSWLKAGLLGILVLGGFLFVTGQKLLYFAPAFYIGSLGLGMRGEPASLVEVILTLSIAYSITAISYFIIGMLVGGLVRYSPWTRYWAQITIGILLVICIFFMMLVDYSAKKEITNRFHIGYSAEDCEKLPMNAQAYCYSDIYQTLEPDPMICKKILPSYQDRRENCAKRVGSTFENVDSCDIFTDAIENTECLHGLAIAQKSLSICESIPSNVTLSGYSTPIRDLCINEVAVASSNLELCTQVQSIEEQQDCIINLAIQQKDITVCEKIQEPHWNMYCVCGFEKQVLGSYQNCDQSALPF